MTSYKSKFKIYSPEMKNTCNIFFSKVDLHLFVSSYFQSIAAKNKYRSTYLRVP